jgi:hypothetical protein
MYLPEYNNQGIDVTPTPITTGQNVRVNYDGLLSRSGANQVYLHAGFGLDNQWNDVKNLKMSKVQNTWQADVEMDTDDRFYFCFHDNAGNWDNNSGSNWSFEVHNGKLY